MIWSLLLAVFALLPAPDPEQAAAAYRDGDFARARVLYRDLVERAHVETGADHGALLFNLGNCDYRLGDYALAILHYRQALRYRPREDSIHHNLRLAQQQLDLPQEELDRSELKAWLRWFHPSELLWIACLLQGLALLGMLTLPAGFPRRTMAGPLLLSFLLFGALARERWWSPPAPEAIVLTPGQGLRRQPHESQPTVLSLPPGTLVEVGESSDRWTWVEHPRGSGWIPRETLGGDFDPAR